MQRRVCVLAVIVLCFAVGTALAADMFSGTWKLNLAKSKFSPGPAPKSATAKIEAVENGIKTVNDGVGSDGKPTHNEFTAKFDGKDYPVKGDPTRDTISLKKIDDYTFDGVNKKAGKVTTTGHFVFSKDGKLRTITVTGTDAQGQKINNTQVYDRQ